MASLLGTLSGMVSGAFSALTTSGTSAAAPVAADATAATAVELPSMLPVKVIFATTTGTAQRYADLLRKEAFAMHVSGFHFEVTCVNAANYIMDDIEKERLVVFLLPTWTGGVPAASAKMLCDHVADMAQDFRVSKDHMARTRFAVFGLGSAEYDKNFCRAAAELDGHLQTLGAEPLCALGRGDDSVDMEAQFAAWRERLWPVLCEVFARECGGAPAGSGEAAAAAGSGCGSDCGSGGDVTSSSQVYRRPAGGVFSDDDEEFVDADDNDDDDGAAPGASAAAGAGSGCCGGSGGGGSGKAAGGECCGGSGACADSASSSSAASVAGSTAGGSSVDPSAGLLPRKEYRKKLKAMTPAEKRAYVATRRAITTAAAGVPVGPAPGSASAARKAAGAGDAGAASGAGAVSEEGEEGAAGGGGEPEFNEEDLLNDALLAEGEGEGAGALDSDDEGGAGAGAGAAAVMGAGSGSGSGEGLADLEDLGTVISAAAAEKRAEAAAAASGAPREMVTPAQRRALTKEGYKLIGSHSAVKICRWTKSMLRGNGGCYKHSLYAIASHLCMEVTPSLACANKCVFCWRHHKNPVGREWRWQIDAPEMIVEEAIAKHVAQIKMLKGLPGLREDRWREAMTPRHCALSLVGEPIMYPHIGQLLRLLHGRDISTFLVTNAQFPDAIAALPPVTQLYVSIDAATKDTLKAIDRPLFADFWERFLACLDALRERKQRTVYRMTLVKGQNMRELEDYAALIARGQPDFIEVKGVTWCGTSPGSNLTMANVPWHHEVKAFCETLAARVDDAYGLAAEHAHSCCVLLAKKSTFHREGRWWTNIDYPKFFELFARWEASGGAETFSSADYLLPTPDWAVYGSAEAGFDPEEVRKYRHAKDGSVSAAEYKSSESGCG